MPLQKVAAPIEPAGKVTRGGERLFDRRPAERQLPRRESAVRQRRAGAARGQARRPDCGPAISWCRPGSEAVLETVARQTGVDFTPLRAAAPRGAHETKRLRVAMYQRFGGGNIDEGWTRLTLEQFEFPYTSIFDPEIKKGELNEKYDVLIIPERFAPRRSRASGCRRRPRGRARRRRRRRVRSRRRGRGGRGGNTPPEYRTGLAAEGVKAIREFVQKGGTLVTLNGATAFADRSARHRRSQRARPGRTRRSSGAPDRR